MTDALVVGGELAGLDLSLFTGKDSLDTVFETDEIWLQKSHLFGYQRTPALV